MNQEEIFAKLNANFDTDILEHFPKSYLDLTPSNLDKITAEGEDLVFLGIISDIKSIRSPFSIIRFKILYENTLFSCAVFNQPFYMNMIKNGQRYCLVCRYKAKTRSYIVRYIFKEDSIYLKTKIKPLYSLPKGISQNDFIKLLDSMLKKRAQYIHELIPHCFKERYKLEDRYLAFKDVHFPTDFQALERGTRVFKYEEALKYSLATQIMRNQRSLVKKQSMSPISLADLEEFIKTIPYHLTSDQKQVIQEIVCDLNKKTVMNRLLQGDVGTGKTLVAMLAMYANFLRNGQSALLAPTQILAAQHYESAKKLFQDTDVSIAFLSGKMKEKDKKVIYRQLSENKIDILIGTHTLISQKINYANLSLAIIDEQQNFGVQQRNDLINKGFNTDLLMMTATPIPRTLSKVINNDMDVSSLNEFPSKQRCVTTKVVQSVDPLINRAILRALEIKRQVFIVAPKIIETDSGKKIAVETLFAKIIHEYGENNVALLHGKMKDEEKSSIYKSFQAGSTPILVATSIIEVGIDIPRACLMVIYSASAFGLSSLHQLRGRIGRDGENALALLVYDEDDKDNRERLEYLAGNDDGYKIAMYDLAYRGAGTLSGINQSGDSDLKVANFVKDQIIFQRAIEDSQEIIKNLEDPEKRIFYLKIYKELEDYKID